MIATDRRGSLAAAIISLCDRLMPGRHEQEAIDLADVARRLGVVDVLYKASRIHGYTRWTERGATLYLAMAQTEGRRRATFAHELGHLILNPALEPDDTIDDRSRRRSERILDRDHELFATQVRRIGIERMCDLIGFELLLPQARAKNLDVAELGVVTGLTELANRYRVSLSLLVNEAHRAGVRVELVRLACAWDGAWVAVDTAGAKGVWQTGCTADASSSERLNRLAARTLADLDLRPVDHHDYGTYSALRHGRTAIAVRASDA